MEPEIRIAPNGDILSHTEFRNDVAAPYERRVGFDQLEHELSRYDKLFEPFEPVPTIVGSLPEEFLNAFEAEFGLTVDTLRIFRDTLENYAIEEGKCVFWARKDQIVSFCIEKALAPPEIAEIALDRFALWPRKRWDKTPEKGFKNKDWHPWGFGRRLSLVSRPLVRIDNGDNPMYVVSPGLLGGGIAYSLARYYEAKVHVSECESIEMKHWIDHETSRRGHSFAVEVFDAVRALGYEAKLEIKMTALLNEKLDKDYGDVDVLAWKTDEKEVLAIECKDLKLAKNNNEIAEQLNQFSGQVMPNGKPDKLLKHVKRCDLLAQRSRRVAKTIGLGNRDIYIQNIVCFSKPVPMQYVAKRFPNVSFITINDLK